ncbi:L,D-transpeptidase [Hoeflea prorocentri]|uniref:L,D-transpeptidase n=1 Tax=Hoeflea prorocentri TaxID=1922333 RepID=A0A9X3ZJF5_9HYPH|nr:L,D-transpeptidase [Hoeflea prorocentri]MCY6382906.1 L,D-transpeptidase [Hoeflea prorocentri]MDA5400706.1 L,D-transpeptidase [Hoeflea prorocentri]
MNLRKAISGIGIAAMLALAGCVSGGPELTQEIFTSEYGSVKDGGYKIPAVPISRVPKQYHRQIVTYYTPEKPGTIIVNTRKRFLYYVLPGNKAVRYGIGVGRAGFEWEGEAYVSWKQPWPRWHPPKEMIEREPRLKKYANGGQAPGLKNPLGARALYLFDKDGNDTLYRLHGSPEWNSIGTAASSGCIRLMNQDVIDLYNRVKPGRSARVVVIQ